MDLLPAEHPPGAPVETREDADHITASGSPWSLNRAAAVAFAMIGLRAGIAPLSDNSFFTHLATGRLILDDGSVPTADPYSFMAPGEPWVVQSWLASVVYASVEKVGGLFGIQLLIGVVSAGVAVLLWRLTQPATLFVGRLAVGSIGLLVGAMVWSERPQQFGLLFMALTLLVAEKGLDPRWLVPVMWLWVNMHGSFVFGGLALVLLLIGRLLDRESIQDDLRALGWATGGVLLAVVNPLGIRLLLFPLSLLERREAFSIMIEWKPPTWQPWNQKLFAAQVVLTLAALLVRHRKWRWIIPVVVFAAASAMSVRNIPPASILMVPALAHGLTGIGSIDGRTPRRIVRPIVAGLVVLGLLLVVSARSGPQTREGLYPVEAITWMSDNGRLDLDSRVVSRDFVGNYMHARFGPDNVRTYIDDRVDMHPLELVDDYVALLNDPDADFAAVLARARPTAVLWRSDSPLGEWLSESSDWDVVHRSDTALDDEWLVAVPVSDPVDA